MSATLNVDSKLQHPSVEGRKGKSSIAEFLSSNELFPSQFFDIKKDPIISDRRVLTTASIVSYIAFAAIFIAMLVTQLQTTTTQTKISTTDVSDGSWDCSMLSVVSESIPQAPEGDFSVALGLHSLNEVKSKCIADLAKAKPCEGLKFYNGVGASASYESMNDCNPYSFNGQHVAMKGGFKAQSFDMVSGKFTTSTRTYSNLQNTIFDAAGNQYVDNSISSSSPTAREFIKVSDQSSVILSITSSSISLMYNGKALNDQLLNIYVLATGSNLYQLFSCGNTVETKTCTLVGTYSGMSQGSTFLIHYSNNQPIMYTAQYDSATNSNIVYSYTFSGGPVTRATVYSAVSTGGASTTINAMTITDGRFLTLAYNVNGRMTVVDLVQNTQNTAILSGLSQESFYGVTAVDSKTVFLNAGVSPLYKSYFVDVTTLIVTPIIMFKDHQTGWYACESSLTSLAPPYDPRAFVKECESNGIMWSTTYSGSSVYLTAEKASAKALASTMSACQASAAKACDAVGKLPPYICTLTVRANVFLSISAAVANSTAVFGILAMILAIVLKNRHSTTHEKVDSEDVVFTSVGEL